MNCAVEKPFEFSARGAQPAAHMTVDAAKTARFLCTAPMA
jgi:hypothetical protein